jgi:hypothetical protein
MRRLRRAYFPGAERLVRGGGNRANLRAASTDAALAAVIGHELAHVNLGRYDKRLQNSLLGAFGGVLVDGSFLVGGIYTFEREADYFASITPRAPATIFPTPWIFGAKWRWKAPTAFASPERIRPRPNASC